MRKHNKRISSTSRVGFCDQKSVDEFRRVRYEVFVAEVDLVDCKDGILSYERMSMLEARSACWYERFEEFGFGDLLQVTERCASDVFVRVLQVVSYRVT